MNPPDSTSPFMKGPKRKRLAKACDACHKSKRRCDGTAPCSNCFYASKQCTYTDASGRMVPAPRTFKPGGQDPQQPLASADSRTFGQSQFLSSSANQFRIYPNQSGSQFQTDTVLDEDKHVRKRFRNERGNPMPVDDLVIDGPISAVSMDRPASIELDPALTRELTNLFFTHCHPARAIVHKPTFSTALSHNRVPSHLLLAVCALAAPLSKQPRIRTSPARFAGKPFAQEALSQMFDGAGRLVVEPDLAAAQALCILQMHDILTKDKSAIWSSRFHDLALQVVEGLGVHSPEHPTLTPVPSPEFIQGSIEREAIRRIFWLIHVLDLIASIYFKKPVTFTDSELRLRLPVDETSFELGVHSTLPEYLYLPAVRMQYASEFGHLIRILTIFSKMEYALDELNDPKLSANPTATLNEAEQKMDEWDRTLPDHLRFSEQSLQVQQSMFETSSNTGAWCWCMLHIYHASCALALHLVRQRAGGPSARPNPQWAVERIELILQMLGDRAKNSILLGCALWSLVKFCKRDDAPVRKWCGEYEEHWGTKMVELIQDWRSQPSPPPPQHQYPSHPHPPHPHAHPHNGVHEHMHRRSSDVRNPGPQHNYGHSGGGNNPRPPIQQHGADTSTYSGSTSSTNQLKRTASHSPPMSYPLGRPSTTTNSSNGISKGGVSVNPGTGSSVVGPSGMVHGGMGGSDPGKYGKGRDQMGSQASRWPHLSSSGGGGGAGGDTVASATGGGSVSGESSAAYSGTGAGGPVGPGSSDSSSRSLPPLGDGLSLPSLKASGLLDSWSRSSEAQKQQLTNGSAPQQQSERQQQQPPQLSPRRTTPPGANANIGALSLSSVSQHHALHARTHSDTADLRSGAALQAMPVGLPWLANESR